MNKKAQSVKNLYTEMQKAFNDRTDEYNWITSKCNRQGELAGITKKGKKIEGMSLGSFKKYCNLYIDGGFSSVDQLRLAIQKEVSSSTVDEINENKPVNILAEAQKEIELLRRNQAILVKAYNELNSLTLDLIANSNGNALEYNKHKKLYSSYFGLRVIYQDDK